MSREDKIQLLEALRKLQEYGKKYDYIVADGFCLLAKMVLSRSGSNEYLIVKNFLIKKVAAACTDYLQNTTSAYLFPIGETNNRMEWLQVEIEKLEACIH